MCSYFCPCNGDLADPWMSLNETYLNTWNRTKSAGSLPVDLSGRISIVINSADGAVTYSTFKDCATYLLTLSDGVSELPDSETLNTGVKIIGYFESKYTCSGICLTPPLFYYTLDLNKGIPTNTCL